MASNKVYKFENINLMQAFLNGAVIGGKDIRDGVYGLVGKKLNVKGTLYTFTAGVAGAQGPLTTKEIKTQLEAGVAGITVSFYEGRTVIVETTPTSGVTVTGPNDGTDARALLGFEQTAGTTTGKLYTPSDLTTTPPVYTQAYHDNGAHVVLTWE